MKMRRLLYLTPKVLAIIFILFLSLFALDVFSMEGTILEKIGGFLIHLLPNFILLAILFVAWRFEKIGGILFILAGIIFTLFFRTYQQIMSILLVSFPLFLIGFLFLLNGFKQTRVADRGE